MTLRAGGTVSFSVGVSGSANQAVVWSVNSINGGNASVGTISVEGLYQAPAQLPASNIITIRATSVANSSASGSSTLTLMNPVVSVTRVEPAEINANIPLSFRVYGSNFANSAKVTLGGNDLVATFVSSTELSASGAANLLSPGFTPLVVTNPNPGSTVSGAGVMVLPAVRVSLISSASLRCGITQQLDAQVDYTSNKSVTWTVNDIPGGNATLGTISAGGLYTSPAVAPTSPVSIKATSVADPTASATCTLTLMNAIVSVTGVEPAEINVNAPLSFKVFGTDFVNGAKATLGNKDLVTTFVSSTELNATGSIGLLPSGFAPLVVTNPGPGAAGSGVGVMILPAVVVNLTPAASVRCGTTKQLEVQVDHNSNKSVTWTVNDTPGGDATIGTISASGLYTSPAVVPVAPVSIKATSVADPTASATCTLTLMNANVSVTRVEPAEINVNIPLSFKVFGTDFVNGARATLGGKDLTTTIVSSTELRATGSAGLVSSGFAPLVVTNPGPGAAGAGVGVMILPAVVVHVTPEISLRCGTTRQLEVYVDYNTNKTVTWTVNDIPGGDATVGTVSGSGLYASPAVAPTSGLISIKATSVADSTASKTCAVTLFNAVPAVTSVTPVSVNTGPFVMTINGSGFARGAEVKFGSQILTSNWVSSTRLDATGTAAPVFGGRVLVSVSNPDPGAARSNTRVVQVGPASPLVSAQAAARFLAQASWGPDPESIARVQEIGFAAYIDEQFNAPMSDYPEPPLPDDMQSLNPAQWRFFTNGMTGQDQLRQRVAFSLSQILVVSGLKSGMARQMVPYVRLLHTNAFGNYLAVLGEVTVNPTMGHFLDMANNYKASAGSGTEPNENYARELLQLFTIGPVKLNRDGSTQLDAQGRPIPAYEQSDIVSLARALTGWTYPSKTGAPLTNINPPHFTGFLGAVPQFHDSARKTFTDGFVLLEGKTAEQDLMAAIIHIYDHPNVGPFISRRLIQHLVTSNPSPSYIDRIASVFNSDSNGQRGNLRSVVKAVLLDSEARQGDVSEPSPTQGHLREPVYFILGLLRALKATIPEQHSLTAMATDMGQRLFYAPSVFNYFSPLYRIPSSGLVGPEYQILTPSTSLIRANFVDSLVSTPDPPVGFDVTPLIRLAEEPDQLIEALNDALMQGHMSQAMKDTIVGTITPLSSNLQRARTALYLVASSSQYQVQR